MRTTSEAVLVNPALINLMCTILYKKTNTYDNQSVFRAYELINGWFSTLKSNGASLPSTFDYFFFMKGMFTVLDRDHALSIAKVLCLTYNNFDLFSQVT
jgi:Protein of unknown function (DUF1765)